MIKGYRIMIYPTEEQAKKIICFCHASRYAYNWALSVERESLRNGNGFVTGYDLTKMFTQFKKQKGNEWMYEVSGRALKSALFNAANAYKNYFEGRHRYPKFRSKKYSKMSCATHECTTTIEPNRIRCEKLGWIKCSKHNIPINKEYTYCNYKLSYDGDNFWFSVAVETPDIVSDKEKSEPIGIDLGIKMLAFCSNGKEYRKADVRKEKKKLKRLEKKARKRHFDKLDFGRKTKTKLADIPITKNDIKLEAQIRKVKRKIHNKLVTNLHTITKEIVELNPSAVVIEDLNVGGLRKNRHVREQIDEAMFNEFRRQLEYKCKWRGIDLIVADRWYPSSKLCSCCGHKKDKLGLEERTYVCEECGFTIDRDLNAAINLKNLANVK